MKYMTVKDVLDYVDEVKDNTFSRKTKLIWLNELEYRVQTDVMLLAADSVQSVPDEDDHELLVPAPWHEIYYDYLFMKLSEHLEESSEQNNRAATFDKAFGRFMKWWADTYEPRSGKAVFKGYYLVGPQGEKGEPGEQGVIANLSSSAGENTSILLNAIEEAHVKGTFVQIPAGEHVFTSSVVIPADYFVTIVGEEDAYAASMSREDVNGEKHPVHNGSCLIYRGDSRLFTNGGNVILSLKNLMLLNERSDGTYQKTGRVFGQSTVNHSTKGKVYVENCCIAGWKYAFGNVATSEFSCVVAERTRFSYCISGIDNNVDGRLIDCSFNKCVNAVRFNGESGFCTISNTRIEWCEESGILITSNGVHDVTIANCEFDRCGHAALTATGGKRITVVGNMFRRNGCSMETGYHIDFNGASNLVINSNNTRYMEILDTAGDHPKKPELSYSISECDNVRMVGNSWAGCENPQTDPSGSDTYDDTELRRRLSSIENKESGWDAKSDFSGKYEDLSGKPSIPPAITEETVRNWGFTKNTGTYILPTYGIPKNHLAEEVQFALGRADTAMQRANDSDTTIAIAHGTATLAFGTAPAGTETKVLIPGLSSVQAVFVVQCFDSVNVRVDQVSNSDSRPVQTVTADGVEVTLTVPQLTTSGTRKTAWMALGEKMN